MKKINVLILSHMYPTNIDPSAGIFVHNQAKHLLKEDCLVNVVSPVPYAPKIMQIKNKWKEYGRILNYDVIDDIPVFYPRYIRLPGKWFHSISSHTMYFSINKLYTQIIEGFQPQILHAYTATPDGYVGLLIRKRYNIPLVCSFMGSDINVYPQYDRYSLYQTKKVINEADQITTVSHALKRVADSISKPKREIQVIYNGCDNETFIFNKEGRLNIRKKLGIDIKDKVIIFIGHLLKEKGVLELSNAFIELQSIYSNIKLIYVGEGPEHLTLKKLIFSKDLNKKVYLMGRQPHNMIPMWLSAADIFVLPTYYEGLPNVVLEAIACGLPIVATNVGGIPEIVKNDIGILIPPHDYKALTNGIKLIMTKIWSRNSIRKHVESYSWEKSAQAMIEIYKKIINV